MSVMRLGYVHVRVTDLEEAKSHYGNTMGLLEVANEGNKVFYKGWDEYDHHSVVLEEGGVGLVKLGYKVSESSDLDDIEIKATRFGATVERMAKGDNLSVGDGLRITLPSDHVVEIYHEIEYLGTETGRINPDPWPRFRRGVGAPRIDHALITVEEPALVERFFADVMSFMVSERVIVSNENPEVIGSWMYCAGTPHDIAFIKGPNGKLHHFAFALESWSDVLHAGDIFAMDDVPVDVGPTRHGITRGQTIYYFDPSGNRNEVFTGGYLTFPDFPSITWTADQLAKGIFYISRELNERFTSVLT